MKVVQVVVEALMDNHRVWKATKFVAPDLVVRATRPCVSCGKKPGSKGETFALTIGRPNYAERKFIALCKKAGEKFPVRKVQLKFPPEKRAA